jgi:TonB family protein
MSENWKDWQGLVVDEEFTLGQYLGGSDHSAVYLTEIGGAKARKAALKFLSLDPSQAERQMARWRSASSLSHPNLQPILDMGQWQQDGRDLLYVVMEYAEEDLSQILPQRPLNTEETREMLRPVLEALRYLHEKKLVHARIKPSNILALGDKIWISSDRICPAREARIPLETESPYTAPEDKAGTVETSSDIWSLGVTLVESLRQHHPTWRQSPTGELDLAEELPYPFQGIVRHVLVREPSKRWNVLDIKSELESSSTKAAKAPDAASIPVSSEPARPASKEQPVRRGTAARRTPVIPQRRISPLWYVIPTLALAAFFVAWISLSRSVPHLPDQQPAPSSAAAESAATPVKTPQPVAKKERKKTAEETAQKTSAAPKSAEAAAPTTPTRLTAETPAKSTTGGGAKGQVLDQVLPDISEKARNTIRGTVRVSVRVQVDPSGSVSQAELDSPGPSQYFAKQALSAAKRWEFISPEADGRSVPSEWILRFEFTQSGTKAYSKQVSP